MVKHAHFFKGNSVILCLDELCISNILLDAPSCGLRREAKSFFFFFTEIMPFKFEYNLNIDDI